jgi:hypothetical protein
MSFMTAYILVSSVLEIGSITEYNWGRLHATLKINHVPASYRKHQTYAWN